MDLVMFFTSLFVAYVTGTSINEENNKKEK